MSGEWAPSSVEELLRELQEREGRMRREYAAALDLVTELEMRGASVECGYRSIPELLKDVLRISAREARRRVQHAQAVTEATPISGGSRPAPLPLTATALRAGTVGAEHLDVITRTLSGLPPEVRPEQRQAAEASLVNAARITDPRTLATFATQLRAYLDQDGTPPTDAELANPMNELRLHTRRNGRLTFTGELDPEAGALFRRVLGPLAGPRPTTDPDPRTAVERQGDALVEILHLAADTGDLPGEAGEKPHLLVTVGLAELRSGIGHAVLGGASELDAVSARRIACDSKIIPVVLGSRSETLDLGRVSYTANQAIRRALALRDNGCAFPGCDRPLRDATPIT